MSSRNRVPSAIEPYLQLPPEASLILLTGTLACSTTWLTSRFVGSFLADISKETAVVLVSFLRDEAFWTSDIRRGTGLDTAKLSSTGSFAFVDGLASLATSNPTQTLETLEKYITTALFRLTPKRTTLILDAPDTLLATAVTTSQPLNLLLLRLRSLSQVCSTVLTLSADLPLVSASTPTPLETEDASFLVQQAHLARFVMGVRELETGAARDVSGVLRVTRGSDGCGADDEDGAGEVREMEALFLVQRDGGVKVFERGASG